MGTGFSKKKKEARMFQDQFSKMQEKLKETEVTGSAANGLVTIKLNGENEMLSVKIQPSCVDPEDVEGLEDLIKTAYQDALKKLHSSQPMPGMGGGMPDLSSFGM